MTITTRDDPNFAPNIRVVYVRLPPDEHQLAYAAAAKAGLSLNTWARLALMHHALGELAP